MDAIKSISDANELFVIEDCAQSHGAQIQSRKVGSFGHCAAFSFYPTKNLSTLGDGGILLTNNADMAEKARALRQYGWKDRFISEEKGMNTRLDEIHAAILNVKLAHLDQDNSARIAAADVYSELLSGSGLELPVTSDGVKHVFHQYVVRTPERDSLSAYLKKRGVNTAIHYPMPVHMQPAYRDDCIIGLGGLQNTESICSEILSLPMHPALDLAQVESVCKCILDWKQI
jgi:dTDP-4-amino-4,6-dideoxygalactose transaminase